VALPPFQRLLDEHAGALLRFCVASAGPVDGEDVFQETVIAAMRGYRGLRHADNLKGWFVMVRDRNGRFPDSDTWGDGWGWAWFDAGGPSAPSRNLPVKGGGTAATGDYRDNCKPCHAPAQATEWIYTEGYPPLKP